MGTQRSYSPEFKQRVVEELLAGTKRPGQLCREHGIDFSTVRKWREQDAQHPAKPCKTRTAEDAANRIAHQIARRLQHVIELRAHNSEQCTDRDDVLRVDAETTSANISAQNIVSRNKREKIQKPECADGYVPGEATNVDRVDVNVGQQRCGI